MQQLQEELTLYRAARDKILSAQHAQIGGQSLRLADLATVERKISELEMRLAMISRGGKINSGVVVFGGR